MQVKLAIALVEHTLEQFPQLSGWKVVINKAVRSLGMCNYFKRAIILSSAAIRLNEPAKIEEVGKHEIAHALVGPGQGHGNVWKAQAVILGIPPVCCDHEANMPLGKWIAVCPKCAKVYSLYRTPTPKRDRWCLQCGRKDGVLNFLENEP